jgi:hypothetical protein
MANINKIIKDKTYRREVMRQFYMSCKNYKKGSWGRDFSYDSIQNSFDTTEQCENCCKYINVICYDPCNEYRRFTGRIHIY